MLAWRGISASQVSSSGSSSMLRGRSRFAMPTSRKFVSLILLPMTTTTMFIVPIQIELYGRSNRRFNSNGQIILLPKVKSFVKFVGRKVAAQSTLKTDPKISKSAPLQTILVRMNTKGLLGHVQAERKSWKKNFIGQCVCDETLQTLFKAAYFTRKQSLSYSKFLALCKLLMSVNAPITTSMYQD